MVATARNTRTVTPTPIVIDIKGGTITGVTPRIMENWAQSAVKVDYTYITVGSIVTTYIANARYTGVVLSTSVNTRNTRTVSIWVINPETGTFAMTPTEAKDKTITMARVRLPSVPTTHCTVNLAAAPAASKVKAAKIAAPYLSFGR